MTASITLAGSAQETAAAKEATTKTSAGPSTLGYESFLQLLIAQMRNQDPLEPTKSSDYVAQLATFSNVEKTVQMNTKLGHLLTNSQLALAGSLVGKVATSADGAVSGVVQEVSIKDDKVYAVLADGTVLGLATGVRIGDRSQ